MKSKKIVPIMISGAYVSGKSTLTSLLEGHSKIFATPFWHDMLIDMFFEFISIEERSINSYHGINDRIITLRKLLSTQDYPHLEQYAIQKCIPTVTSVNTNNFIEFDFDYYKHSESFFKQIYNLKNEDINLNNLICIFCKTFVENCRSFNRSYEKINYYISQSEPGFKGYDELFKKYSNVKAIYIKRNKEEWFLAFVRRLKNIYTSNSEVISRLLKDKRMRNVLKVDMGCYKYQDKYPGRFLVVDFDELIMNHEKVIRQVASFLEIEFEDILLKQTWFSKELGPELNSLGTVIDRVENLGLEKDLENKALAYLGNLIKEVEYGIKKPEAPNTQIDSLRNEIIELRNEVEENKRVINRLVSPYRKLRRLLSFLNPFKRAKKR